MSPLHLSISLSHLLVQDFGGKESVCESKREREQRRTQVPNRVAAAGRWAPPLPLSMHHEVKNW